MDILLEGSSKTMQRIVRAYRNKIRRQLQPGSEFSFWRAIGNTNRDGLVRHIWRHFEPGMTWKNYGEWHLVNTSPLTGPIKTPKQFSQYFHFQNYRPKWRESRALPVLKNGKVVRS